MDKKTELTPEELVASLKAAKEKLDGLQAYLDTPKDSEVKTEVKKDSEEEEGTYLTFDHAMAILDLTAEIIDQGRIIGSFDSHDHESLDSVRDINKRVLGIHNRLLGHLEK